jgi:hypothetical protein
MPLPAVLSAVEPLRQCHIGRLDRDSALPHHTAPHQGNTGASLAHLVCTDLTRSSIKWDCWRWCGRWVPPWKGSEHMGEHSQKAANRPAEARCPPRCRDMSLWPQPGISGGSFGDASLSQKMHHVHSVHSCSLWNLAYGNNQIKVWCASCSSMQNCLWWTVVT